MGTSKDFFSNKNPEIYNENQIVKQVKNQVDCSSIICVCVLTVCVRQDKIMW